MKHTLEAIQFSMNGDKRARGELQVPHSVICFLFFFSPGSLWVQLAGSALINPDHCPEQRY